MLNLMEHEDKKYSGDRTLEVGRMLTPPTSSTTALAAAQQNGSRPLCLARESTAARAVRQGQVGANGGGAHTRGDVAG